MTTKNLREHLSAEAREEFLRETTCPRCGGGIPNDFQRGEYPGALSRKDNQTEVCSGCGTDEAMRQFLGYGGGDPWPGFPGRLTLSDEAPTLSELSGVD